ncbi:MAG: ABC transporter ATP-binding protein [Ectothiorhodospiraceae bacterium]|nr:ABC transporter ATP-binding protein [Ectothiorhodospiraceae bacterium]MCH8506636.1 ABC transporter ATP-binding protein [Ectothiorhodospiraceae bacterium]
MEAYELVIDIPGRSDGVPLNLDIRGGQVWGVLGPNGAGKSTLLHTLAGLRRPRSGQVLLDGKPLLSLRRRTVARHLAVIFQERHDSFPASVLETAMIGRHPFLSPWDVETAEDIDTALQALRRMDLAGMEQRSVGTLSGGERQRLAVATAITQTPSVWLADEPTNHLDLHHQVSVMRLLAERAAAGDAVFMCLHDINLAARWCDQLLLLYPDGNACWGKARDMLVPSALERLYGQSLASVELHGAPVFVPTESARR